MQMTHKYIRPSQREENLFLEEYYSGTDTKVYLNGEIQSEISYISFSLNEQLKPIYGYASRTFDDMAVGSRIVTGVFKMPIVNPREQDTYETVVLQSTTEEIENKNLAEQQNKNNTEWIITDTEDTNAYNEYITLTQYQKKLSQLGFPTSVAGVDEVKMFQKANKLPITGTLDTDTMKLIDEKIEDLNATKRTAKDQMLVYIGPTRNSGITFRIEYGQEFYIVSKINNEFTLIKTTDGKQGFILNDYLTGE